MNENIVNIDREINKDDALNILDRIIGFVNSCDNKASIILGIIGVMLSIIFASNSIKELKNIIKSVFHSANFIDYFYLFILVLFSICLVYGIFKLVLSLFARTNCLSMKQELLDLDSKLYFCHISENNTYKQYKKKILECSREDFLNDIISQIYINSNICSRKYEDYNQGLIMTLVGFIGFIFTWFIGSIYY